MTLPPAFHQTESDDRAAPGMRSSVMRTAALADDPVVVYAPAMSDGTALQALLQQEGFKTTLCVGLEAFTQALADPVGLIVFSQEAFAPAMMDTLRTWLATQEPWSEPPVLALLDPRQQRRSRTVLLSEAMPRAGLLVLERPVRATEFITAVQSLLTNRRRQLELRDQLALQAELLSELNHRVKNALANVYAVFRMTYRNSADLETFGETFEARLLALSRVHQTLTSSAWQGADLKTLTRNALEPYGGGTPERYSLAGPRIMLPPRQALSLALIVHELATNAAKYGALSDAQGTLDVSWKQDGDAVTLRWAETGGPAVTAPARRGFGTAFIQSAFASEADGGAEFDFRPSGLVCTLRFTLDAPFTT